MIAEETVLKDPKFFCELQQHDEYLHFWRCTLGYSGRHIIRFQKGLQLQHIYAIDLTKLNHEIITRKL